MKLEDLEFPFWFDTELAGASREQIDELEREAGVALPHELRKALALMIRDGGTSTMRHAGGILADGDQMNRDRESESLMAEALRRSWANGARPSELLRSLLAEGVTGAWMITLMQQAFSLPLSKTGAIPAWATDRDDDRLDRILNRLMPARDQQP